MLGQGIGHGGPFFCALRMAELTWKHFRSPPDVAPRPVWCVAAPRGVAGAPPAAPSPRLIPRAQRGAATPSTRPGA